MYSALTARAAAEARRKEMAAWTTLGQAVQVSKAGALRRLDAAERIAGSVVAVGDVLQGSLKAGAAARAGPGSNNDAMAEEQGHKDKDGHAQTSILLESQVTPPKKSPGVGVFGAAVAAAAQAAGQQQRKGAPSGSASKGPPAVRSPQQPSKGTSLSQSATRSRSQSLAADDDGHHAEASTGTEAAPQIYGSHPAAAEGVQSHAWHAEQALAALIGSPVCASSSKGTQSRHYVGGTGAVPAAGAVAGSSGGCTLGALDGVAVVARHSPAAGLAMQAQAGKQQHGVALLKTPVGVSSKIPSTSHAVEHAGGAAAGKDTCAGGAAAAVTGPKSRIPSISAGRGGAAQRLG